MASWKAIKKGVNLLGKSLCGLAHRNLAKRVWEMSAGDVALYQRDRFLQMYDFARKRVPYYAMRSVEYPELPRHLSMSELTGQLPILTKQLVREHNQMLWPDPKLPFTYHHRTSGTTGTPLILSATLLEKGFTQASFDEWKRRICGTRYPRTLHLTGFMTPAPHSKELYWYDPIFKQAFLSIYSLHSDRKEEILSLFKRLRPQYIQGFPSALHQLALLVGQELSESREERVAMCSSEVLQPHWRTEIEAGLCRKLYDYYGSQEMVHAAFECDYGQLHLNPLFGYMEIVDEAGAPVQPGEAGRVLVTGLIRRSMPLIRYEIGDVAVSTGFTASCECGLHWRTVGHVDGRTDDQIETRDGRKIGVIATMFNRIAAGASGILEAQLIQTDYDEFRMLVVRSEEQPFDKLAFQAKLRDALVQLLNEEQLKIKLQYIREIPRGANGKFKFFVNQIAKKRKKQSVG